MTREEVWETLKKYDPEVYSWLEEHAYMYGITFEMYAQKLKEDHHDE